MSPSRSSHEPLPPVAPPARSPSLVLALAAAGCAGDGTPTHPDDRVDRAAPVLARDRRDRLARASRRRFTGDTLHVVLRLTAGTIVPQTTTDHPPRRGPRPPVRQQRPRLDELRARAGHPGPAGLDRPQGRVRRGRPRAVQPARRGRPRSCSRSRSDASGALGLLLVLGGSALALALQVAAPVGVPLYDGVPVVGAISIPPPDGRPGRGPDVVQRDRAVVAEGVSPVIVAATTEIPPQAQLIAQRDAFELTRRRDLDRRGDHADRSAGAADRRPDPRQRLPLLRHRPVREPRSGSSPARAASRSSLRAPGWRSAGDGHALRRRRMGAGRDTPRRDRGALPDEPGVPWASTPSSRPASRPAAASTWSCSSPVGGIALIFIAFVALLYLRARPASLPRGAIPGRRLGSAAQLVCHRSEGVRSGRPPGGPIDDQFALHATRRLGVLLARSRACAGAARLRHRQGTDPDRGGLPDLRERRQPGRPGAHGRADRRGPRQRRRRDRRPADRAGGARPALARRGRRRHGRPGRPGDPDRDRRLLVRPVDGRQRGGRPRRAPVLGGGRRGRSPHRTRPADGLPRRHDGRDARRELVALRGAGAGRAGSARRLRSCASRSRSPTTSTRGPSRTPPRRRRSSSGCRSSRGRRTTCTCPTGRRSWPTSRPRGRT